MLDKPHLDLTTPLGRGFVAFLSAMAEEERERILARCNAGRQVAIKDGVRFGRKPKVSDHQQAEALKPPAKAAGRSPRRWRCNTARLPDWPANYRECIGQPPGRHGSGTGPDWRGYGARLGWRLLAHAYGDGSITGQGDEGGNVVELKKRA